MKILFIFLFLGFLFPGLLFAQIDSLYEALTESIEEDNGISEILEQIQKNPLNINKLSKEDLKIFPFLNDSQIDSIIKNRPFTQKRQVREILDKNSYKLLRPFFTVKPIPQKFTLQITQRNYLPMYKVKGIIESKFRGDKFDNYSRIRFSYTKSVTGGFLIQKDLGENEILDHYSGFLQWQKQNLKIILGNYQIQFGHGLIMDSPYAAQKSVFALAPLRSNNSGGRYYLSSSEFTGFSGIFTHYSPIHNFSAKLFCSSTLRDGNIDDSGKFITGLNNSGYHRTDNEYDKKDLIRENMIGGYVQFKISDNIEAAFCATKVNYNPSIVYDEFTQTEKEFRRNHFQFSGDQIDLYSLFFHSHYKSFEFSSEISTNRFEQLSHSYNVLIPIPRGGIGFKWWHISKDFQSPFGHSFSTSSNFPRAKQGFYLGMQHRVSEEINCSSYWSVEKHLYRTYFDLMPTTNKDFLFNLNYKIAKKTDLVFRYQFSDNNFYDSDFPNSFSKYRKKFRLDFIKLIFKNIRVRSRIEKVFITYSDYLTKQLGTNLYQDISWQVSPILNIKTRFSSFISENYDSRIYEFENDVPGAFSNYALSGRGTKWYILVRLNIFNNLRIWLKYRTIYYDGVKSIGSGDLQSEGNTRQKVSLQFSYIY